MPRPRSVLAAVVVTAIVLAATSHHTQALHRNTPPLLQITDAASAEFGDPMFAGRSNVLVFHSDGDLLGNGNSIPQIFVFDLASRVKKGQLGLFQVTDGAVGSYEPTGAKRARVLAFHSEDDLLSNGSSGRQVFAATKAKWKKGQVPLVQVTRGPGESFGAVLSDRGKFVLFSSTDDLLAEGLPPGTRLYQADLRRLSKSSCPGYPCPADGNPGLLRITDDAVEGVSINKTGSRIAFTSRADAAGTGCGTGVAQLFLWDGKTGTTAQMTCGTADSRGPVFTRNFRGVLFESDADLLGAGNGHTQIYHLDVFVEPPVLSQSTFGADGDSRMAAPNGTSRKTRFFFMSSADLTGSGTSGSEHLHSYDAFTGVQRLTNGVTILSRLAGQFLFAAFASADDLIGNGNDTPQMFIMNADVAPLLDPTVTPTPTATATPTATTTPTPTPTVTPTPVLERLVLAPVSTNLQIGETKAFAVIGHFTGGGTQNLTQLVTYTSSDPGVVVAPNTPADASRVEALATGVVSISAVHGPTGVSTTTTGDDAVVTVVGGVERIVIAPAIDSFSVGEIETFTATAHFFGGGTENYTQLVTYASSAPAIAAALNTPGNRSQIEALSPGVATISATDPVSGVSSSDSGDDSVVTIIGPLQSITLSPASTTRNVGESKAFTAIGHYGGGSTQNLTQLVVYASSNPSVASAPNTPGNRSRVDAVAVGIATISATHVATGVTSTASGGDATFIVNP